MSWIQELKQKVDTYFANVSDEDLRAALERAGWDPSDEDAEALSLPRVMLRGSAFSYVEEVFAWDPPSASDTVGPANDYSYALAA